MLSKLLAAVRLSDDKDGSQNELISPRPWNPPPLRQDQIRVIVFQDSNKRGKVLLYDSLLVDPCLGGAAGAGSGGGRGGGGAGGGDSGGGNGLKPNAGYYYGYMGGVGGSSGSSSSYSGSSSGKKGTQEKKLSRSDVDMLGEMMFGAIPLAHKHTSTKVHFIRSSSQIVVSKLFSIRSKEINSFHKGSGNGSTGTASSNSTTPTKSSSSSTGNHSGGGTGMSTASSHGENLSRGGGVDSSSGAADAAGLSVNKSWSNMGEGGTSFDIGMEPEVGKEESVEQASNNNGSTGSGNSSTVHSMGSSVHSVNSKLTAGGGTGSSVKGKSPQGSPPPSPGQSPRPSIVDRLYRQKRLSRSKHTSIEYGHFRRLESDDVDDMPSRLKHRRPMYAIGIMFNLSTLTGEKNRVLQEFFFSHYTLIESHIQKLYRSLVMAILQALTKGSSITKSVGRCSKLESLYSPKQSLNEKGLQNSVLLINAIMQFRGEIHLLYSAPRVQEPVWLNMVSFSHLRKGICKKFMKELVQAIIDLNNEDNSYFLGNLLTAVLAHHLAWVPTVAPTTDKKAEHLSKQASQCLELQARFFPYNPLWAQLGDLYGCIGSPVSLTRTVVVGKKADTVCRLLYLLSYFIRCSEVFENIEQNKELADRTEENIVHALSGTSQPGGLPKVQEEASEIESVLSTGAKSGSTAVSQKTANTTETGSGTDMVNVGVGAKGKSPHGKRVLETESTGNDTAATATSPGNAAAMGAGYDLLAELDPFDQLVEIPMPRSIHLKVVPDVKKAALTASTRPPYAADRLYSKNFGRSLLGGYYNHYISDFALLGVSKFDFLPALAADLKMSVEESVLEEPVKMSNCIIADTDKWTVKIATAEAKRAYTGDKANHGLKIRESSPSSFINSLLVTVKGMYRLGLPHDTCLMFIEDKLQELYHKSKLVASFVAEQTSCKIQQRDVVSALGLHKSDMPLLIAIAGTHFPGVSEKIEDGSEETMGMATEAGKTGKYGNGMTIS
eukprot:Nk52_evm67s212 gene=Nk52_evmTU67s212